MFEQLPAQTETAQNNPAQAAAEMASSQPGISMDFINGTLGHGSYNGGHEDWFSHAQQNAGQQPVPQHILDAYHGNTPQTQINPNLMHSGTRQ